MAPLTVRLSGEGPSAVPQALPAAAWAPQVRTRLTRYTRDGRKVQVTLTDHLPTSYRIEGRPAVRHTDFLATSAFHSSLLRVLTCKGRPRGLPRV